MRPPTIETLCTIVFFLVWCNCTCVGQTRDNEAELVKYLKSNITNYSPLLYPRLNRSETVNVTMRTMLGRLVSVESANQSVKVAVFMDASWDDERLVWNPANFGDIYVINWEASQLWFPVILIYNGIGDSQVLTPQIPIYLAAGSLNSTLKTTVTASWRREFEFSCRFEMSEFPMDEHICDLEFFFSSQGRSNQTVRPVKTYYDFDVLAIYQPSSEWILLSAETIATEKKYKLYSDLPPLPLPTYILRIKIKRVSTYYVMNVVTPLLLLALLQALVFALLPVNCEEKLGFGITIMLSYTVFLLLLDKILPKSQSMPAIGTFIIVAMILSTVSLLFTSLSKRMYFSPKGTKMPACTRAVVVELLGRLLCMKGAAKVAQKPDDVIGFSMRSVRSISEEDDGASPADAPPSDWIIGANAVDRLVLAFGVLATAIIIGLFIIAPYV